MLAQCLKLENRFYLPSGSVKILLSILKYVLLNKISDWNDTFSSFFFSPLSQKNPTNKKTNKKPQHCTENISSLIKNKFFHPQAIFKKVNKTKDCSHKKEEKQCDITLLSSVGQSECLFHQNYFNFEDMKPRVSFSDLPKPCSYPLVTACLGQLLSTFRADTIIQHK